MPDIASWHPQIVHFVIALGFVGIIARVLSLLPLPQRFSFISPAATTLIVLSAAASVFAVSSGDKAHSPVERVPGARDAVVEHEDWGKRARNGLLIVAVLELGALAAARWKPRAAAPVRVGAAAAGLAALFLLFEAAEHGGELVYNYAGGVGIRSGDTADVRRLLVAGLYHNAVMEREANRPEAAHALFTLLNQADPGPLTFVLRAESFLRDAQDPTITLSMLRSWEPPADSPGLGVRRGMLMADAFEAMSMADSARATLQALAQQFPNNVRVRERLNPPARPAQPR